MKSEGRCNRKFAKWSANEKMRQERLYAATIAQEFLLLLMTEESMQRERLEQRFRHEQTLILMSLAVTTPALARHATAGSPESSCERVRRLSEETALPFDRADQLSEEEIERIWQQEKRSLQQRIISVNYRVQKLRS